MASDGGVKTETAKTIYKCNKYPEEYILSFLTAFVFFTALIYVVAFITNDPPPKTESNSNALPW